MLKRRFLVTNVVLRATLGYVAGEAALNRGLRFYIE